MVIVVTGPTKIATYPLAVALADRLNWPIVDAHAQRDPGPDAMPAASPGGAPPHRSDHLERMREMSLRRAERRESLILAAPPLSHPEYVRLTDGVRRVRVVSLRAADQTGADSASQAGELPGSRGQEADHIALDRFAHITLDSAADIETLVGSVRAAFGV